MNIHRDTEYRFGELVQSPEYSNEQGVVVTIKSLATGQIMRVYLEEPVQQVDNGINVTTYAGHFDEEEFMVTLSEGLEITGLPLMYPYTGSPFMTYTQNNSLIYRNSDRTDPENLAFSGFICIMADFQLNQEPPTSGNAVEYRFKRSGNSSEDPAE